MRHVGIVVSLSIVLLTLEAHRCWGRTASWVRSTQPNQTASWVRTSYDQDQVPFYQRFRNRGEPSVEPAHIVSQIATLVDVEDLVVEVGDVGEAVQEAENLVVLQEFTFEDPIRENDHIRVEEDTVPIHDATIVDVVIEATAENVGNNEVLEAELIEEEVMVEIEDRLLVNIFTEVPLTSQGEVSTGVNTNPGDEQNMATVVPANVVAGEAEKSLNSFDSTTLPSPSYVLVTVPRHNTPMSGAIASSEIPTGSSSHAPSQGIAPTPQGSPPTATVYVPIRQTTPTVSPPLPARQGYAPTIQQTRDGMDPLDRRPQHLQPVPSTYDGIDSFIEQQTTPPPPQRPINTHVLWPRPNIVAANSHNIRQRPPILPSPHMVYNPQPRNPESFLGPDPAHPRGPQPWSRWIQGQPSAGHLSNSWTHPSRRRNPSHL